VRDDTKIYIKENIMKRLNRSFSRRIGKTLSPKQKDILEKKLDEFLLKPGEISEAIAEIGIGMGEHFINQAKTHPDILHIGFEPYMNGVANALNMATEENIANIRLWPDDMDMIFDKLPSNCLKRIYVLFPDPWPKNSQKKRRIICEPRLKLFHEKLQKKGGLFFASDIDDYSDQVFSLLDKSPYFDLIDNPSNKPHDNYIQTKYHSKALSEGRVARFVSATTTHT
jgi:release factor glutamine methyltransferase